MTSNPVELRHRLRQTKGQTMSLSEGDQGYSVAEGRKTGPAPSVGRQNMPSQYKTADNVKVDPQFSDLGDIKPTHGNSGSKHDQPSVGYQRAD